MTKLVIILDQSCHHYDILEIWISGFIYIETKSNKIGDNLFDNC